MGKKRDTVRKSPKSTRPAASSETLHDREELGENENTLVGPNTLINANFEINKLLKLLPHVLRHLFEKVDVTVWEQDLAQLS